MRVLLSILLIFYSLFAYSQSTSDVLDVYMSNYEYTKALSVMEERDPTRDLLFKKALCYKGLESYSKAIDVLHPLSEEYSDDKRILSELALCYQLLSNWTASQNCYDRLIKMDSTNVYYQIQMANILFRQNDYKAALSAYKSLTDNHNFTNMIKRSAQCYENMNLPDSAMLYYKRAWGIDSTDTFSATNLINLNIKQGKKTFPDAIKYSEAYIRRDSTNKQINLLNALSYYALDLYEEAAERFEKCYAAGDSSVVLNRSLGIAYYCLGSNIMAQPFLKKAYEQDSTNINVLYCLGTVSNAMAEYGDAIKCFSTLLDKVVPADMTLYVYYKGLGNGYEGVGESADAVESYKLAERYATPAQKMVLYYNMASLYDYQLKIPSDALEYYNKYKVSLTDYLQSVKDKEKPDDLDINEIKSLEMKIHHLQSHIKRLETEANRD